VRDDVVEVVGVFKASIRARRSLLELLFQTALEKLVYVQDHTEGSEAVTIAQWLSQDCANALVLIVGYSLERFLAAVKSRPLNRDKLYAALDQTRIDAYHGVNLGSAIVALGDLARHLHGPQAEPPVHMHAPAKQVLDNLCLGETHDQAAAQFLWNLTKLNRQLTSYGDFETALLAIADAVAATS
jgi:hypothetical protein